MKAKATRAICHLNIIGYKAAVAGVKNRELRGRPFVIAGAIGGRALIQDLSPEALKQGLAPGIALAVAERKVKDLTVLAPDPPAYETMNRELEKIAAVYAPAFENDTNGNLYLDLTGTAGLFGPPADCTSRILREIFDKTGVRPVAAVAGNKLIGKTASRVIRPVGLIQIQYGTEAAFLAHQDLRLLPGMGPSLLRTAEVTGFREVGELATLSDSEALSLFGKRGLLLRDTARGIDDSPVVPGDVRERNIQKRLDFAEDTLDYEVIRGGLIFLAETAGIEMRRVKLSVNRISLSVMYADGVMRAGEEREKRGLVTDREIAAAAEKIYLKIVARRLRVRAMALALGELRPLGWEPDLFLPEPDEKGRRLQEAADGIRGRFGFASLMTGTVMTASRQVPGLALPCKITNNN
jgi:DNA polymerase-4